MVSVGFSAEAFGCSSVSQVSLLQQKCAALPYQELFAYLTILKLPDARKVYGEWLNEVMAPELINASDDTLSSRLTFVGDCGSDVSRRLDRESSFRADFLRVKGIWPRFRDCINRLSQANAVKSDVYYQCGSEPQVWDFFRREDSVKLFEIAGMDAVTMLIGEGALHRDVEKVVCALWAGGVLDLPRLIQQYDDDVHFRNLVNALGDKDNWGLLNAVVLRFGEKGNQWPQEAKYLSTLNPDTLRKELHPKEPSVRIIDLPLVSPSGAPFDPAFRPIARRRRRRAYQSGNQRDNPYHHPPHNLRP